jgi:NAD(P)-dependent dehydrogenase (short-subunit alcohol dehydrogenase family)
VLVCVASLAGCYATPGPGLERHLATAPASELLGHPDLDLDGDGSPAACALAYVLAKRGNQLRVQAQARRYGQRQARIVSVSPGLIASPMGRAELAGPLGTMIAEGVAQSPAGRAGTPEDVAAVVAFLAGPEASFITGSDILLDGGRLAVDHWDPGSSPITLG